MRLYKLDVLLALYIGAVVASELMGAKTTRLFGLNASVAIFVFPLTYTINDVVSEVFGKERARSFVRSALVVLLFLLGFNLLATALPPSGRFVSTEPAYQMVFSKSLRIIVASLIAFGVSEFFDVFIYARLRQRLGSSRMWLRNNASNFLGQLVDTSLFIFLAFWEPGSLSFVVSLIIPYWLLKCGASVVETPFSYLGVRWLKDKVD